MLRTILCASALAALASQPALAGPEKFQPGTAVAGFGKFAPIEDPAITPETKFRIAFDIAAAAQPDQVNRNIDSAARFLNMVTAAGVPAENIDLAIVVHGPAGADLRAAYKDGSANPTVALVAALIDAGVSIQLCGQTAAMSDIAAEDLVPGVTIPLSAMTAHALLQQQGYTLNPF